MIYNTKGICLTTLLRGVLLFALAFGALSGCGGPEERKAKYRDRAEEYLQQGNYPKARVALRNVLKIDPKDIEAFYLFAEVEEREKNWRNAYANYLRVVELKPDHEAALVKLGKIYLEGRAFDKASETIEKLLATYPGHVQGRALQIAIHAVTGQEKDALHRAEVLFQDHSDIPDVAMLLSALYNAQNRLAESERVLRQTLATHPHDLELLNALASTYVRSNHMTHAEQIFQQIVQTEPTSFDHRLRLAGFYDQQKDYAKAEEVLRDAIRLDPAQVQRRLTLADFQANRRGNSEGERVLLEAIDSLPRATTLHFALGRLYERSSQIEKARSTYRSLSDEYRAKPVALEARVKLASLDWESGNDGAAMQELDAVLRENPRAADAILLQGKIALHRGHGKDAVQSFRTVLKDQPDVAEAHTLLGQAYLILGETSLARESFERAITLNPRQFEAHVALANLDMAAGRKREARIRLEQILTLDPNNIGILGLLLNMQASEKDWIASQETLSRLRANGSQQGATDLAEGYLHQARQEYDQAASAFTRAQLAIPSSPEPLMALVRLDIARGKVSQAQSRLEAILSTEPTHSYAHGLLGELLLLKHDEGSAEHHFQEATRLKPEWITPWLNWAGLRFSKNRQAEAQQILRKGVAANPTGEILRMVLATSLSDTGRVDEAITEYRTILVNNPQSLVAANNLAALLAEHTPDPQSLDQALALSRDFERRAPNPLFLDTLGWIHHKMGHRDDALRVMREAVAKAPDHPVLNYHAGVAYFQAGFTKEAKMHLEKAVRIGKAFVGEKEARTLLAEMKG